VPVAHIQILQGHSPAVLKQLLREASAMLARVMQAPVDRVQVSITEISPALCAVCGEPADELLTHQTLATTENPMIKMVLLEGRPVEKLHEVMREISNVTSRVLGGDPQRVRVQIDLVSADRWAIGGEAVALIRARELTASATAQAN
jgi:4-oxalocrotonate tautomerase family enzyme